MTELTAKNLIDGSEIRRIWHEGQWYYGAIDIVVELLEVDLKTSRNYYHVLKRRLKREGVEIDHQHMKLTANDGKKYLTEVVTTRQALRLVLSISSPKAEVIKEWLSIVGEKYLEEPKNELNLFGSI